MSDSESINSVNESDMLAVIKKLVVEVNSLAISNRTLEARINGIESGQILSNLNNDNDGDDNNDNNNDNDVSLLDNDDNDNVNESISNTPLPGKSTLVATSNEIETSLDDGIPTTNVNTVIKNTTVGVDESMMTAASNITAQTSSLTEAAIYRNLLVIQEDIERSQAEEILKLKEQLIAQNDVLRRWAPIVLGKELNNSNNSNNNSSGTKFDVAYMQNVVGLDRTALPSPGPQSNGNSMSVSVPPLVAPSPNYDDSNSNSNSNRKSEATTIGGGNNGDAGISAIAYTHAPSGISIDTSASPSPTASPNRNKSNHYNHVNNPTSPIGTSATNESSVFALSPLHLLSPETKNKVRMATDVLRSVTSGQSIQELQAAFSQRKLPTVPPLTTTATSTNTNKATKGVATTAYNESPNPIENIMEQQKLLRQHQVSEDLNNRSKNHRSPRSVSSSPSSTSQSPYTSDSVNATSAAVRAAYRALRHSANTISIADTLPNASSTSTSKGVLPVGSAPNVSDSNLAASNSSPGQQQQQQKEAQQMLTYLGDWTDSIIAIHNSPIFPAPLPKSSPLYSNTSNHLTNVINSLTKPTTSNITNDNNDNNNNNTSQSYSGEKNKELHSTEAVEDETRSHLMSSKGSTASAAGQAATELSMYIHENEENPTHTPDTPGTPSTPGTLGTSTPASITSNPSRIGTNVPSSVEFKGVRFDDAMAMRAGENSFQRSLHNIALSPHTGQVYPLPSSPLGGPTLMGNALNPYLPSIITTPKGTVHRQPSQARSELESEVRKILKDTRIFSSADVELSRNRL